MREHFSICLAGDCTGYNLPETKDPLRSFRGTISTADMFLCNLEGVVISPSYLSFSKGLPPSGIMKPMVEGIYGNQPCLFSFPTFTSYLNVCRFNVASIATNHILDWGRLGIIQTKKHLAKNNILPVGAGLNLSDACRPLTIEADEFRIGVLSYCVIGKVRLLNLEIFSAGFNIIRFLAGYGIEGTASYQKCSMKKQIEDLTKKVDLLLVALHIGDVWKTDMNKEQLDVVGKALNAGADIVVCHHSHVPSGIVVTRDRKLAFLGMGDFIFNYNRPTAQSLIANVTVYKNKLDVVVHPVKLIQGVPTLPTESESVEILEKIRSLSRPEKLLRISDGLGFLAIARK